MKPEPQILDAEYRVVGESRWAPFRRWCAEMRWKFVAWLFGSTVADWVWWRQITYAVGIAAIWIACLTAIGPLFRFFRGLLG